MAGPARRRIAIVGSGVSAGSADRRTVRAPTRAEAAARDHVLATLGRWTHGGLALVLPDGGRIDVGAARGPRPRITVHDWAFFPRLLLDADIGAGEAYVRGEWDSGDLVAAVRLALEAPPTVAGTALAWVSALRHVPQRAWRRWRRDAAGSNVRSHYDLGNAFFARFLDASMTYSAAVYPSADATLEEAQKRKHDVACRALGLGPGKRLLDLGCGWGALALHAARHYGCRATAVTLSPAQAEWARARVRAAGLAERVDVRLADWRQVGGTFDAVASVEMLEAIGYRAYGAFFGACERRLAAGGRLFVQAIAYAGADYHRYRLQYDFLRKHVFAGGLLPSARVLERAAARSFSLRHASTTEVAPHYVRTLADWGRRLGAHAGDVAPRLRRTWEFYLALCEAGFASRHLSCLQMVFVR